MMGSGRKEIMQWFVLALLLLLQSCGGGGSGAAGGGSGTLELGLTDAATKEFQAVYVTIAEVQVNRQSAADGEGGTGWETIMTPGRTYNLLELVNGVTATLGVGELEAGRYGQMRLILGQLPETPDENILGEPHPYANYLIDGNDDAVELKVPSGYQTGIKIVKGFTIEAGQATELLLDFDAARSVVQAGKSGKWLLKPTIKVLETVVLENSISGVVDDGTDPVEGALVSAQVYDSAAPDVKDMVIVEGTTLTDGEGAYKLYLPRDTYTVVAAGDGFLPGCQEVEAQYFEEYIADFSLSPVAATIMVTVNLSGLAAEDDTALLSVRQHDVACGGAEPVTIEVASLTVTNGDGYSFTLPAGSYDLVASAAGETTQVVAGISTDTEVNVSF